MQTQQQSQLTAMRKRAFARIAPAAGSLFLIAVFASPAFSQTSDPAQKAAYLYHFARYVSGMGGSFGDGAGELVIGVLGESSLGEALSKLAATKTVRGKRLRIQPLASLDDYHVCDILFIAEDASPELLAAVIRQTDEQPLLLVAETPGFCELGGTVNLRAYQAGRLGIEINVDALARRHLVADARLLKLARIVRDSSPNGF